MLSEVTAIVWSSDNQSYRRIKLRYSGDSAAARLDDSVLPSALSSLCTVSLLSRRSHCSQLSISILSTSLRSPHLLPNDLQATKSASSRHARIKQQKQASIAYICYHHHLPRHVRAGTPNTPQHLTIAPTLPDPEPSFKSKAPL